MRNGKGVNGGAHVVMTERADGSRRAGDERHQRTVLFVVCFRLPVDARLLAVIVKGGGRDLATRIAVDARRIDIESRPRHSPASVV
jgi:hypothetical protein